MASTLAGAARREGRTARDDADLGVGIAAITRRRLMRAIADPRLRAFGGLDPPGGFFIVGGFDAEVVGLPKGIKSRACVWVHAHRDQVIGADRSAFGVFPMGEAPANQRFDPAAAGLGCEHGDPAALGGYESGDALAYFAHEGSDPHCSPVEQPKCKPSAVEPRDSYDKPGRDSAGCSRKRSRRLARRTGPGCGPEPTSCARSDATEVARSETTRWFPTTPPRILGGARHGRLVRDRARSAGLETRRVDVRPWPDPWPRRSVR